MAHMRQRAEVASRDAVDFEEREWVVSRGRAAELVTVESCLAIDLAAPGVRTSLMPGQNRSGVWQWSLAGRRLAAIRYHWVGACGGAPELSLSFAVNGASVAQRIHLAATRPRFGGARWWFVCPVTGRRARVLFLPPGRSRFGSRLAYRLTYQSRRERPLPEVIARLLARKRD